MTRRAEATLGRGLGYHRAFGRVPRACRCTNAATLAWHMNYDPEDGPRRDAWLATDEATRLAAVRAHHHGDGLGERRERLHAAIHVVVENQLAEGLNVTTATLDRLILEGLGRHEAIHAIGSVVAEELFGMLKDKQPHDPEVYARKLDGLSAESWRHAPATEG